MKNESIYSCALLIVNIILFMMDRLVGPHVLDGWGSILAGEPLPGGTLFAARLTTVWSATFIVLSIIVLITSFVKEKVAFHLLMITVLVEILFVAFVGTAYVLPMIHITRVIGG